MVRVFTTKQSTLFFDPPATFQNGTTVNREVFRADIWQASQVKRIAQTLNSRQLPSDQTAEALATAVREAINVENKRQCDVWNANHGITD